MAALDGLALVNLGRIRTGPPATGAEPQRDTMLRAHIGRLVIRDGTEVVDEEAFCVLLEDADTFPIRVRDEETFCVVLRDDEPMPVRLRDEETFCVVLDDDEETRIK